MLNLLIINNGERELLIIISGMYSPFSYNEKNFVFYIIGQIDTA